MTVERWRVAGERFGHLVLFRIGGTVWRDGSAYLQVSARAHPILDVTDPTGMERAA